MAERMRSVEAQAFWEKAYLAALSALIQADRNAADHMGIITSAAARTADQAKTDWIARF